MFPLSVVAYVRLANKDEVVVISEFADEFLKYMSNTPVWRPKFKLTKESKIEGEYYE